MLQEITKGISQVGFPIMCVLGLSYFIFRQQEKITNTLEEVSETNKALSQTNRELSETNKELSETNKELSSTNRILVENISKDMESLKIKIGVIL